MSEPLKVNNVGKPPLPTIWRPLPAVSTVSDPERSGAIANETAVTSATRSLAIA
jgi:hypothetical protein